MSGYLNNKPSWLLKVPIHRIVRELPIEKGVQNYILIIPLKKFN